MSKSLNELTYSILEAVSAFNHTDDFPITNLWVEDQLISQNHSLIRKAKKERRLDAMLYVLDTQVEIRPFTEEITIEGITINSKSGLCYADMNELVSGLQGMASVDYSITYSETEVASLIKGKTGYFDLDQPSYALLRKEMLFNSKDIGGAKFVNINGIWRDPRLASSWSADDAIPTPSERNLEILTIQHIGHALGFPADLISDAQRALGQPPKQKEDASD